MIPRERVLMAIEHKEPDRVPLAGSFRPEVWEKLKRHFGVDKEEPILKRLGIDFRGGVGMKGGMDILKKYGKKAKYGYFTPNGWDWVKFVDDGVYQDEWGIKYKMGSTGKYWHFVEHPLHDAESMDEYEFPNVDAPGRFDEAEKNAKKYRDKYVIVGACAMCGATFFEIAWHLRGFRQFIKDLYYNPRFANQLLDRLLEFRLKEAKRQMELGADIMAIGDDVGMQTTMLLPPDIWRKYLKPRYEKLISYFNKHGVRYVEFGSDGYWMPIIPDLIDMGVDILICLQPECMDLVEIKNRYGDKLTLSDTISVQYTLPYGTPEEVKNAAIERIKTCAKGGGLIIGPSHVVPPETPVENIITLYDTVKKYGKY